jgi:pyrroloquinoline quinone (PQQ) biosynthesis protein C
MIQRKTFKRDLFKEIRLQFIKKKYLSFVHPIYMNLSDSKCAKTQKINFAIFFFYEIKYFYEKNKKAFHILMREQGQ